jgi:hypothetical protein
MRERRAKLDNQTVQDIIQTGNLKAQKVAKEKMETVNKIVFGDI